MSDKIMTKIITHAIKTEKNKKVLESLHVLKQISSLLENHEHRKESSLMTAMYSLMILAFLENEDDKDGEKTQALFLEVVIKGLKVLRKYREETEKEPAEKTVH